MSALLTPFQLGPLELPHRMVMAPMTRNRAGEGNVPHALNAEYYRQRASAGLIITEASQVAQAGQGYPDTPGIHNAEQVKGWRKVTEAVHRAGGRIFLQLWHVGRISHPDYQPGGGAPIAPSAVRPDGEVITPGGSKPYVTPRALDATEIPHVVAQFRQGAINAAAAGFDGVEIHGANGYLIDQFLRDGTNQRTDRYGGSLANRARFMLEVTDAVAEVWGPERVGIRLSPANRFNRMSDADAQRSFGYFAEALSERGLAYLHGIETKEEGDDFDFRAWREQYDGTYMANSDYDRERGEQAIDSGHAELVSYGRPFLANPDLPARFEQGAPLNEPDRETFYGGGAEGYTDYPTLRESQAA